MNKENKQQKLQSLSLSIIYAQAAGIDVGSMNMVVSYPGLDGMQTVREYDAYTKDLDQMAKELQQGRRYPCSYGSNRCLLDGSI